MEGPNKQALKGDWDAAEGNCKEDLAGGDVEGNVSSKTGKENTGSQGDGDGQGLMLIVGPEKLTTKVTSIFDKINEGRISMKATPQLKPEDADRWKNSGITYIVFIIDSSDPQGLKDADEQISYLDKNYVFSYDRINCLLAQEPGEERKIKASDIAGFMEKFRQPLINMVFENGWENDATFHEQLRMFMNRFENLASTDPADNSSNNSSQSHSQ